MKREDCYFKDDCWVNDDPTLILVKITELSSNIHRATFFGGANRLVVNQAIIPLFDKLPEGCFKRDELKLLSFQIEIDNTIDENIIYLYNKPKSDIVVIPVPKKPRLGETYGTVTLKPLSVFSEEEIKEYKSKFNAYLAIIRYK